MNDYQDYQHPDCVPVLPQQPFQHIALTFSGGGFRAASFSLGALSYLYRSHYEKFNGSLLDRVKFITSTSGGSITNGKFAAALYADPDFSFETFYAGMRDSMDGEKLLSQVFSILQDDQQWQVSGDYRDENGAVVRVSKSRNLINAFAKAYNHYIFEGKSFDCIYSPVHQPSLEKVCFNATEFNNGLNFYFQINGHTKTIDKRGNGYLKLDNPEIFRHLKIGDIVAASSCFPSGFEPIIYPNDFINENLTDVGSMLKAISYDHNNPTELKKIQEKPFALMDGGIVDNMGVRSVMIEDSERLRLNKGSFDLILACDVTSYFTAPLQQTEPKKNGWTTKFTINSLLLPFRLAPFLFLLCLLSIFFSFWPIAGYMLLLPSLIASLCYLWVNGKLKSLKHDTTGSIGKTVLSHLDYFQRLPLASIVHMVQARISSSVLLVSDLFLKQIRRGQYDNLFTKPRLVHRTISCLIYEFSTAHEKRRLDILTSKDVAWWKTVATTLMPSKKMQAIANEAKSMGTTLWFDESDVKDEMRDKIIATGQFTMCYNLIKHICRLEVLDNKYKSDTALQKLKSDLLKDWERFRNEPMFMVERLKTIS